MVEQKHSISIGFRVKTLALLLGLLVCAQCVNGVLTILSFKGLHLQTMNASYESVGVEVQKDLERALRFGKPLKNFLGMEQKLATIQKANPDLDEVAISAPDGQVLYSLKAGRVGSELPPDFLSEQEKETEDKKVFSRRIETENAHHLVFPLRKRSGNQVGLLDLSFTKQILGSKSDEIVATNLRMLTITTLGAAFLLFVGFQLLFLGDRRPTKKHLYLLIFTTVAVAQLSYAAVSISEFKASYLEITEKKIATVAGILKKDIEKLLSKGVKLDALVNIENELKRTADTIAEVNVIRILDPDEQPLYSSSDEQENTPVTKNRWDMIDLNQGGHYDLVLPLNLDKQTAGLLDIEISGSAIMGKTKEILLDSLTVVALSFLFLMELLTFLFVTGMGRMIHSSSSNKTESFLLIRPAIALYIYAASLCYSFIPLYMAEIYKPMLNFSKDFVVGLPISVEMLCGGIALIPVGHWIDKRGWHQPFITGACLSMVGTIMSGMASSPEEFIIYRGLTGLGYGFCWMSAQGFILLNTDKASRAQGLSSVVAGIFSGIICGSAIGGMVAERVGYAQVFFIGGVIMFFALLFVLYFMRGYFKPPAAPAQKEEMRFGRQELLQFIFNRNIFLIFTCSIIPYSVCMVGLLYYISPIYLTQLGTSQSNIGRVIMVFGLCMIYIAPQVSRFVDKFENKKLFISMGGVMGSMGMMIFYYFDGFWAVVVAIFVLGLSVSVSAASRNIFTIDQSISKKVGISKVMGVYRTVDKIGQTLGPVLLGLLLLRFEIRQAVGVIGVAYIIMTLLFMLGVKQHKSLQTATETTQS
ncbi:MAG: MFS transporter [Desulfuromonadales bacterium]|nr:MFS transporter [Desulfuromonadales bacterium]